MDEVFALASEGKLVDRGKSKVYGRLKAELWRESVGLLDKEMEGDTVADEEKDSKEKERGRVEQQKRRVEEWERGMGKRGAKL